jgi:hypothetical protein
MTTPKELCNWFLMCICGKLSIIKNNEKARSKNDTYGKPNSAINDQAHYQKS